MIPVAVSYFDISAEQEWDGDRGHHVSVGFSADIPDTIADDRFDLLEDVEFVMEWKETSGDGSEKLIISRIIRAFPRERISVVAGGQISRQRRVFITRRDLRWENGFPEMAEMFCRVSLTPILTTARRSIPIERINGRYRMIPGQVGNPPAKTTPGFEY